MNTYAVMLDCKGDQDHEPHSEPMIIVSVAESVDDADKLAGLLLILASQEADSLDEVVGNAEKVSRLGEAIANVLKAEMGEEELEVDPFSGVGEVSEDVEF